MANDGGKTDGPKKSRGLLGFLETLNEIQEECNEEMKRDAEAKGKKPPKDGSMMGLLVGLGTLAFGDKIKTVDEKFLDWELNREKRELEIEKVQAERQRYVPRPAPKNGRVLQIMERLRLLNIRDSPTLLVEQEKLIAEVRGRRKGQSLTEDDFREIESIKEAVACYLDELLSR